jgi:hypothetical protein
LADREIGHILAWPQTYDPDAVLVPAALRLARAAAPDRGPAVEELRAACLGHLRARIAQPLALPADWSRAHELPCHCVHCTQLARYLADPAQKTWMFKAIEMDRCHIEQTIEKARCDVDTFTERHGRPESLGCTKNQASYERRAPQRAQDLKNLAHLEG